MQIIHKQENADNVNDNQKTSPARDCGRARNLLFSKGGYTMATFPRTEPEIVALAEAMEVGLTANAVLYPAPPVAPLALTGLTS